MKYYLTDADGREWPASAAAFAEAERAAGFVNLSGGKSPTATAGFSTDARFDVNGRPTIYVRGRVEVVEDTTAGDANADS